LGGVKYLLLFSDLKEPPFDLAAAVAQPCESRNSETSTISYQITYEVNPDSSRVH